MIKDSTDKMPIIIATTWQKCEYKDILMNEYWKTITSVVSSKTSIEVTTNDDDT